MVSEWLFFSLLEILNIFFPWFIFIFGREGCHLTVYIWDLCFLLFIFLHTWVFHVLFCSRAEFIKERIFSSLRHGEEAPSKRDVASCDPSPAVEVVITLTGSGCHHNNRHPFKTHTHTIHNPAFFLLCIVLIRWPYVAVSVLMLRFLPQCSSVVVKCEASDSHEKGQKQLLHICFSPSPKLAPVCHP